MERITHKNETFVQLTDETIPMLNAGDELYIRTAFDNKDLCKTIVKLHKPVVLQHDTGNGNANSLIVIRPDGVKWSVYMSELFARELIQSPTAHSVPQGSKVIDISSLKFHKEGEYYISEDHSVFLLESKYKSMFNDVE